MTPPKSSTKTKAEKAKEAKAKKAAEEKAAREAEAKAKREAKEQEKREEREALIDSGALIENGDFEFHLVEKDNGTVEDRADAVLKALVKSDIPVVGNELQDEFGGGWPQYLSFFAMLKVQGLVTEYRRRGGERGSSGVAYLASDDLRELVK